MYLDWIDDLVTFIKWTLIIGAAVIIVLIAIIVWLVISR